MYAMEGWESRTVHFCHDCDAYGTELECWVCGKPGEKTNIMVQPPSSHVSRGESEVSTFP